MRIAISGTIGSGKSEVCAYIRKKGHDVFDCDEVNRKLLEPGNEGYLAVRQAFPECFSDDVLDKRKLSSIVFNDPEQKKVLEDIMHPLILQRLLARKDDPLFCEVPLLFEAGWEQYFDLSVLVVSSESVIRERLKLRSMDERQISERLANQMSVAEKLKRADEIIYNDGSLEDLHDNIERSLKGLL